MMNFLIFSYFRAFNISCSAELSMKKGFITSRPGPELMNIFMLNSTKHVIFLLKNVKMPTVVGILTFMSLKNAL